jgi:hypothetical protein
MANLGDSLVDATAGRLQKRKKPHPSQKNEGLRHAKIQSPRLRHPRKGKTKPSDPSKNHEGSATRKIKTALNGGPPA